MAVIQRATTKAKPSGFGRRSQRNSFRCSKRTFSWTQTPMAKTWSASRKSQALVSGSRKSGFKTAAPGKRNINTLEKENKASVSTYLKLMSRGVPSDVSQ